MLLREFAGFRGEGWLCVNKKMCRSCKKLILGRGVRLLSHEVLVRGELFVVTKKAGGYIGYGYCSAISQFGNGRNKKGRIC